MSQEDDGARGTSFGDAAARDGDATAAKRRKTDEVSTRKGNFDSTHARSFLATRDLASTDEMDTCPYSQEQLEEKAARLDQISQSQKRSEEPLSEPEREELKGLSVSGAVFTCLIVRVTLYIETPDPHKAQI